MVLGARISHLRQREGHAHAPVTFVELFFDLVFVFAITQISHGLLEHLSVGGAVQAALLLMAVWWVWIYTCWCANWLNPRHAPVRLLLFGLMLAGLMLSASIPEAFGTRALPFALAYVASQVGRSLFMLWALRCHNENNFRNFQRIAAWLGTSAAFWIAGGFASGGLQFALWGVALLIEYVAPSVGFRTPGLGRSSTTDWDIEGAHIAERCGLFVIIALGESILVTGATFARLEWNAATLAAFAVAFTGSVAMWWVYFDTGAERGSRAIAQAADPGRIARLAYTYLHLPVVAGIIVGAVADELILVHPDGHTEAKLVATALGGPALFLFGNLLFKRAIAGRLPLSHLAGLALLAVLVPVAPFTSPLAFGALAAAVLVVVAAWETRSLRQTRASLAHS